MNEIVQANIEADVIAYVTDYWDHKFPEHPARFVHYTPRKKVIIFTSDKTFIRNFANEKMTLPEIGNWINSLDYNASPI